MALVQSTFSASGFLGSLGVNTHLPYTDGAYFNTQKVLSDLQYLGITQVRDEVSVSGGQTLSNYEYLADNGITFALGAGANSAAAIQSKLNLIDAFVAARPGAVTAIEGLNEINNWPITWSNGDTGLQAGIDAQRQLYNDVKSDALLHALPVYYLTGYGSSGLANGPDPVAAGLADYDNQHPYAIWGFAPNASVSRNSLKNENSTATPAVFTETGYSTNTSKTGIYGGVDQRVQAVYTLDLLFDAASAGISKTYLYDLMDAYAPGSKQGDDGFGLFDYTNAPKLAATAIHNLTTLLHDNGANAATYRATPISYSLSGMPSTGNSVQIRESDGSAFIVLWAEPQVWNMATMSEIAAPVSAVTCSLGPAYQTIQVFDPLVGVSPIASYANSASVTVGLTDHPLLIKLSSNTAPTVNAYCMTYAEYSTKAAYLAKLGKYTVSLSGAVAGLNAVANDAHVTAFQVVDTASNLRGAVLAGLGTNARVKSVAVSDGKAIVINDAQYAADKAGVQKLTGAAAVTVSNVTVADLQALDQDSHVTTCAVVDTGAALSQAFEVLGADAKVSSIAVTYGSPLTITYAQYLSDGAALAKLSTASKFSVSGASVAALSSLGQNARISTIGVADTAANLANALAALGKDAKVKSLTISGSTPLALSYGQFSAYATAVSKIVNYNVSVFAAAYSAIPLVGDSPKAGIEIRDTAAHLSGDVLTRLGANAKTQSITVTDGKSIAMTYAQYLAAVAGRNKLAGGDSLAVTGVSVANLQTLESDAQVATFQLRDTASAIDSALDVLEKYESQTQAIAFTDATPPTLVLTQQQAHADADLLRKIASPYILEVTGVTETIDALTAAIQPNRNLLALETSNSDDSHVFKASGDNLSFAANHDDTFLLTGHHETISFSAAGFGADAIVGYTKGDVLSFSTSLFANFQDLIGRNNLMSHAAGSGNSLITDAHGDSVLLKGISPASLTSSMFRFV